MELRSVHHFGKRHFGNQPYTVYDWCCANRFLGRLPLSGSVLFGSRDLGFIV